MTKYHLRRRLIVAAAVVLPLAVASVGVGIPSAAAAVTGASANSASAPGSQRPDKAAVPADDSPCVTPGTVCAPGGKFTLTYTVTGSGDCSWTASIDWGDGTTDTVSYGSTGFTEKHQYAKPGLYDLSVTGSGTSSDPGTTCTFNPSNAEIEVPCVGSSCVSITSPPANSIIAVTDGNYLQPQPGPNEPQPAKRELNVTGDAPASDASITLNGEQVPVTSGTWTAKVPVTTTSLGTFTLTAADATGSAQETITLIDLVVTSPSENTSWPITAVPAMPAFDAQVQAIGYSGDTSGVTLNWTLDTRGEYINRSGWHSYSDPITGSVTGTQTPWNPSQGSPIVGGTARLSVSADLPGVLDSTVQSEPRWINIPGTNPHPASVNSTIAALDPPDASTVEHIFCWESGGNYEQFNPAANQGEPAFTNIPADWTPPNPPVLQPHYGAPPAGTGIAQLDPASFPGQQWDWTQNVSGGVTEYQKDLAAAQALQQKEQTRLDSERTTALKLVNATRAAQHPALPPITVPREIVPLETANYPVGPVTADAITRYNTGAGFSTYYFDYHFLASPNNLQVLTQGTGQWVTKDGKWQTAAQWQAQGGIHSARLWLANPSWNPGYVGSVEGCTIPQ